LILEVGLVSGIALVGGTDKDNGLRRKLDVGLALVQGGADWRIGDDGFVVENVVFEALLVLLITTRELHALRGGGAVASDLKVKAGHVELRADGAPLETGIGMEGKVKGDDLYFKRETVSVCRGIACNGLDSQPTS